MRSILPQDLFEFRLLGDSDLIPKTNQLVYVQSQASTEDNQYHTDLWILDSAQGAPRALTQGPSDSHPRVSPDGRWLAFLRRPQDAATGQIWLMDLHGGEPFCLSPMAHGVESFLWRPDSQGVFALAALDALGLQTPQNPDGAKESKYHQFTSDIKIITTRAHKLDGEGYFGDYRRQIVDYPRNGTPRQLTHGPRHHQGLAVTPDGRYLITASRYGEDADARLFDHHLYRVATDGSSAPERITPIELNAEYPVISPDGKTVAFLGTDPTALGYDNPSLFVVPIDGSALPRRLGGDWDRPIGNLVLNDMPAPGTDRPEFIFAKDGQSLLSLASSNGQSMVVQVPLEPTAPVSILAQGPYVIYQCAFANDGAQGYLFVSDPTDPSQVISLDHTGQTPRWAPNRELLSQMPLAVPERFEFHAHGGPTCEGWIMMPPASDSDRPVPVVLEIHGGPMALYGWAFFLEFQWLTALGYAVVFTNPRGSQGYGEAFCRAIQRRWGDLDYEDLIAGLDHALAAYGDRLDPTRLGVMGGSYGGYMTNWIIGHNQRFRAAITMRSVVDWRTMLGTGDAGPEWIERADGVWPWQDDAWYRQQSPLTYVEEMATPLLIEHQEDDLRCPIAQGEMLYSTLRQLNRAPVKMIRYPGESHGMSRNGKPWHRIFRLDSFRDWFEQYL